MLKSLDLIGFKSFADKTSFEFSPGITGVVGPNGSGKSNVVDGVKWILGNQSAKSLRGKEMTDVIFNGSAGRKGAGFAEATLHFDNSSGFLPIDLPHVSIGRRIWSGGDSEYLINQQTARLKDIKDLLAGTGIGASAYCIIEQGRVDQILQSNPANRRSVFEEAAGISRFKGRKAEALRKLERVEQNLQRLTDIVDEVEARLNATRGQAAKAAKYRELSEELRQLWTGLAADDSRRLSARLAQAERILAETQRGLDDVHSRQNLVESQIREFDNRLAEVEDQLRAVDRLVSDTRQKISAHQTTIRHQSARQREMETELVRLRRQRTIMHNRETETRAESARSESELTARLSEFESLQLSLRQKQNAVESLVAAVKSSRAEIESLRIRLLEKTREQASARSRDETIQSQLDLLEESDRVQHSRGGQIAARIEEADAEIAREDERVRAALADVGAAENEVREQLAQRERIKAEEESLRRKIAELREQRSAAKARKAILEDLELRQEGIGLGVRDILDRARSTDLPPWNGIRGSVVDLLDVDLEHAALLEVALGARAQLILIDELSPLIEYLHHGSRNINGRVGFLALRASAQDDDQFAGATPAGSVDLFDRPGVVNRADRLVKSQSAAESLSQRLLADTWIVDTLAVAFELAGADGAGCRFVTLQGELLESDGTLFVGTVRGETSLVSRRSELRRLKSELLRFDRLVQSEEQSVVLLQEQGERIADEIEAARGRLQQRREQLVDVKNRAAGSHGELAGLRTQLAEIEALLQESNEKRAQLLAEQSRIVSRRETLEAELEELQTDIDALEERRVAAEDRLHEHDQQLAADRLELAKAEERVNGLRQSTRRLREDLTLREQQRQEAFRRFDQAERSLRETKLTILNTTAELAELYLADQEQSSRADRLLVEKDEARLLRGRLAHQDADFRKQRRELGDRHHQAEMQARDARFQLETLQERIEEEYGLTLDEIVAGGASALRDYVDRRMARPPDSSGMVDEDEFESLSEYVSPRESAMSTTQFSAAGGGLLNPGNDSFVLPEGMDYDEIHAELEDRVNRLRRKIKMMGSVDTDSLANLDELEQRYTLLSTQLEDLVEARNALEEIIRKINQESKRLFKETFDSIRGHFQELFRKLFGGGEGDIILEDPNDVLECGVDIVARPPGKELRSISLLSGGEKTMTAVALLMSIFKSRPSPFCILDEVDAALDEANIDRFIGVVREFQASTQFIIITHRKPTMTVCDLLYGVTMEQSGVSKRMTVRFEEVLENGEFKSRSGGSASDAA